MGGGLRHEGCEGGGEGDGKRLSRRHTAPPPLPLPHSRAENQNIFQIDLIFDLNFVLSVPSQFRMHGCKCSRDKMYENAHYRPHPRCVLT